MIWHRLDTSNASIDTHEIGLGTDSVFFAGFRSLIATQGGRFKYEFPGLDLTEMDTVSIWTTLCHKTEDWFLLGIPWDGARVPSRVSLDSTGPFVGTAGRTISLSGSNIADVLADTSGATGWQDTANDMIWVQVRGTDAGSFDQTAPVTVEANFVLEWTKWLRIVA
jgi:hypothetical protein